MIKIALVSITLNAVNPMMEYLGTKKGIQVTNYLDEFLTEKIRNDKEVNDESMGRMLELITKACKDGAQGIILTCTVFSDFVPYFNEIFSIPIIAADDAMMEKVGKKSGKTTILCTFESTIQVSKNRFEKYVNLYNTKVDSNIIWLSEAFEYAKELDMDNFDRVIREELISLDGKVDNIVLAQISMTRAIKDFQLNYSTIYSSPEASFEALMAKLSI